MTRKEIKAILDKLDIPNRFKLRTVSFSDIARGQAQVVTICDWQPDPRADQIEAAFREYGIITEFDY